MLDMDETLVHSEVVGPNDDRKRFSFVIDDEVNGSFGVHVRPMCHRFLRYMAKYFEVVVYTAGQEEYGERPLLAL